MTTVLQDLRHGARLLLRAPGFAVIAIAALAIGIGANTAIFSVVNTLLIQDLPYKDPDRLAVIWEHNLPRDRKNNVVSPGNFIHWREMNQAFEDISAVGMTFAVTLTGAGDPEELPFQFVSASFFQLLGVQPALGRPFTAEEDRPRARVVVISDRLWRHRFSGDPGILSRPITLQGEPYTVTGVMPPGFYYMDKAVDVWMPVGFSEQARTPRGRWLTVLGRLKPGVTFDRAQEEMTRVHGELTRLFPDFNTGWTARVVPLKTQLTGDVRPALLILLGAVAFVLMISCANVANLLLARATARQRELAVRAALGAARARLIRQLLAESSVLAVLGGAAGLLLAWWGLHLLRAVAVERLPIPRLEAVGIDAWVLAFTVGSSLLSGLFFGLVPALSASGSALTDALKEGGRSGSAARGNRTRSIFVVVEVSLAVVLLVGAGLLVRSFVQLLHVNPGFDPARTVTMRVGLPGSRYEEDAKRIQFYQRLFEKVDALAGVQASGGISFLPLVGLGAATGFEVVGRPVPPRGEGPVVDVRVVANGYFKAMGVPLLKGRLFTDHDPADSKNHVIINETMARKYWPGEDPIGKRVKISWNDTREDEIIGVVGDVRHAGLATEARAASFWPYPRFPYPSMTLAVRTSTDATSISNAVVRMVRELDPDLAVADVRTMEDVVSASVAQQRLTMLLLTIFAAAALLLAAVGIYGVIAYSVTQRTQEIGIRMALGARHGDVLRMVVGQAMALSAVGILIGGAGAFLLTRLMTKLLFNVTPGDPLTFAAVAALLGGVAAIASYVPGRRATRVDPVVALRAE
jgi:putative ABC transport system permease protein